MTKRYLFTLLILFYSVFANAEKQKLYFNGDWELCSWSDAKYFREVEFDEKGKPVGTVKDYFISGELQMEAQYYKYHKTKVSKCKYEGKCTWYYKNGSKSRESHFVKGKEQGVSTYWFKNGKVKSKGGYIADKQDGDWEWFHDNGAQRCKGKITKGKRVGEWKFFTEEGKKDSKVNYRKGELNGACIWYHSNGKVSSNEQYKNGKLKDYDVFDVDGKPLEGLPTILNANTNQKKALSNTLMQIINKQVADSALGVFGEVIVSFKVTGEGEVDKIEILRSTNVLLNPIVIHAIKQLPKFPKSRYHGRPLSVVYNIPVQFSEE